jgi:hypothetical protein
MRLNKQLAMILMAVFLALTACCACTVWARKRALNWGSFEVMWWVVNRRCFDPTFGGVDWQALRAHYRRQVVFASDADYYRLVNEMLWQLNISHLAVTPPGYWARVEPCWQKEAPTSTCGCLTARLSSPRSSAALPLMKQDYVLA